MWHAEGWNHTLHRYNCHKGCTHGTCRCRLHTLNPAVTTSDTTRHNHPYATTAPGRQKTPRQSLCRMCCTSANTYVLFPCNSVCLIKTPLRQSTTAHPILLFIRDIKQSVNNLKICGRHRSILNYKPITKRPINVF